MKAYSLDLRQRVVTAYEARQTTLKEVAERFAVGETFVKKMLSQKQKPVSIAALGATLQREGLRRKKNQSSRRKEIIENEPGFGGE